MSKSPEFAPGTVSKILWHFTGGPTWNAKTKRQAKSPKASADAYQNLRSILQSRELRLGSYTETVRVVIPEQRVFDRTSGKSETRKNVPAEIESAPVCCLSDIPAAHLGYHSYRYGKFAIGFHRDAAVRHGFNPVFYSLEHTGVVRSIYDGFSQLEVVDPWGITSAADEIQSAVSEVEDEVDIDVSFSIMDIESEAESLSDTVRSGRETLREFVAFVKTFQDDEFATIYCEREWRALKTYSFSYEDVAMIVVPRRVGRRKYFDDFVARSSPHLKLPRSIPIVPWEDLVEH